MATKCTHLDEIKDVKPHTKGCEECLKIGDSLGAFAAVHDLREGGVLRFF